MSEASILLERVAARLARPLPGQLARRPPVQAADSEAGDKKTLGSPAAEVPAPPQGRADFSRKDLIRATIKPLPLTSPASGPSPASRTAAPAEAGPPAPPQEVPRVAQPLPPTPAPAALPDPEPPASWSAPATAAPEPPSTPPEPDGTSLQPTQDKAEVSAGPPPDSDLQMLTSISHQGPAPLHAAERRLAMRSMWRFAGPVAPLSLLASLGLLAFTGHAALSQMEEDAAAPPVPPAPPPMVRRLPPDSAALEKIARQIESVHPQVRIKVATAAQGLSIQVDQPEDYPDWVAALQSIPAIDPGLRWEARKLCAGQCNGAAASADLSAVRLKVSKP